MYKILVVDDEKLAREDIVYKIGASGLPVTWLMEAESGEEALQIIETDKPDIMLTDIMMEEISGLDLIRETNRLAPQMISVIICGYPDFSFAQRAIELGAANYLLKPVKSSELAAVLSAAEKELRSRREQNKLSAANYTLRKRLEGYALRERVNAFLNVGLSQDMDDLSGLLPEDSRRFQLWDIFLSDPEKKYAGRRDSEAGLLYGVCNIIREIGASGKEPFAGYLLPVEKMGRRRLAIVTLAATNKTEPEESSRELACYAEKVKTAVENSLGVYMFVGISRVSAALSSTGVLEARKALDVRLYYAEVSRGCLLDYTRLAAEKEDGYLESDMALFKKAVFDGRAAEAVNMVEVLIAKYRERPRLGVRDVYVEIIHNLSRASYKKGVSILRFLGSENISGAVVDQFETMDEVCDSLKSIVNITLSSWVKYQESTADVLARVKQYIDEHFGESVLCTNELAKIFCISVGYLSASYNKFMGITITKYITRKRMEYAAKLLAESDVPINRISEACGYNNSSYFMKVFKDTYKSAPAQYRNAKHAKPGRSEQDIS